ncbi:MAG: UDP-glucose 4-epimerase GalE [Pseudorhodobacter sp.]
MKLLLTGGAGYIGSHVLLQLLEAGHDVTVLDSLETGSPVALERVAALTGRPAPLLQGDIRDEALLERAFASGGFEAVMHFAGLKSVSESVAEPLRYYDCNFSGTLALVRAMRRHGTSRLVFSSTAAVYGEQAQMPVTEESPLAPAASPYGRSKRMVEQALEDMAAANPALSVAILRYFNPAGAHPSGQIGEAPNGPPANLIPFVAQVAAGQRKQVSVFGDDYPTRDGTGIRDYIHVMDLAEGHLAALKHIMGRCGAQIWNLGTGRGASVAEILAAFGRIAGYDLPYEIAPRRPGDLAQCWADPARARADLGWQARFGLEEMLADHWRWQQMNPHGYGT